MNDNYFNKLNSINVSEKIEKKNGLSYLSWAWAWSEVKKIYPNANYKIYETENGCIYWHDGKTAWVKTGVTINDIEHIEYLPVMDFRNKSIAVENITSFDANKTIQRSLTKAVARHGLGLYIYVGEDLPEEDRKNVIEISKEEIGLQKISKTQEQALRGFITSNNIENDFVIRILKDFEYEKLVDIRMKDYKTIYDKLEKTLKVSA